MEAANKKTWKLLAMYGGLHPKSNTCRLYNNQKEGRQGRVSIKANPEYPGIHQTDDTQR